MEEKLFNFGWTHFLRWSLGIPNTLPLTISHFEGCHTYSKEFKKKNTFLTSFLNEVEGAQRMKYICWTMKVQKRIQFRPMCFGHAKQSDFLNYLPYLTILWLLILKRSEMFFFNSKRGQKTVLHTQQAYESHLKVFSLHLQTN